MLALDPNGRRARGLAAPRAAAQRLVAGPCVLGCALAAFNPAPWYRRAGWGLVVVTLFGCHTPGRTTVATPAVSPGDNPNAEPLVAEAVVRNDPQQGSRHYVYLPVTLHDRPVSLLLDTGTGFHLYLFTASLAQVGMTVPAGKSGNALPAEDHVVDALTIGTSIEPHVPVATGDFPLDTTHTPPGLPPLIGILGNFQLPHYDLLFDGPASRVRLYQISPSTPAWDAPSTSGASHLRRTWLPAGLTPADCTPLQRPETNNHTVYIHVVVNGQPIVDSYLDSGDNETEMNVAMAKLLGLTQHTPNLRRVQDNPAVYEVRDFPMTIGNRALTIPTIVIHSSDGEPFIKFGLDAFRDRVMLISYSTSQVCLGAPR